MAWLIAGAGIWYVLDQAYTAIHDNTVKPVNEWIEQRDKERIEREDKELKERQLERRAASQERARMIREKYNIPNKQQHATDVGCW